MNLKIFLRFDFLMSFIARGPFRIARVKGLGKETTVYVVYPYGLTANAPEGSLCVSWQVSGQESDRVAIADDPQNRPKDLEPGEVVVSNHLTKSEIRFKANGDIDITAPNMNVIGDLHIVGGSVTHNGTNIGDTHIHSQGSDSNGDNEVDTGGPHS